MALVTLESAEKDLRAAAAALTAGTGSLDTMVATSQQYASLAGHGLLDSTIRELGDSYGRVHGTKGKAGIAFIVASGDAADQLTKYIKRSRR
jgi:hypothetical protein